MAKRFTICHEGECLVLSTHGLRVPSDGWGLRARGVSFRFPSFLFEKYKKNMTICFLGFSSSTRQQVEIDLKWRFIKRWWLLIGPFTPDRQYPSINGRSDFFFCVWPCPNKFFHVVTFMRKKSYGDEMDRLEKKNLFRRLPPQNVRPLKFSNNNEICCIFLNQVKIWFQNRRSKYKKMMKAAQQVGGSGGNGGLNANNSASTPQMSPSESEGGSPSPECGDDGSGYLPLNNMGQHPHQQQQQQHPGGMMNYHQQQPQHQSAGTPVSDLSPPPPTLLGGGTGSPPLSSAGSWMDTKPSLIQMGDPSAAHHHHHHHHQNLQQQMGAAAAAAAAAANYGMPYPWQYAATMNQGLLT